MLFLPASSVTWPNRGMNSSSMPRNPLMDRLGRCRPLSSSMNFSLLNTFICRSKATSRRPYVDQYPTKPCQPASPAQSRRPTRHSGDQKHAPYPDTGPESRGREGFLVPLNDDHRGQSQSRSASACRQPTTSCQGPPSLSSRHSPCHEQGRERPLDRSPLSRATSLSVLQYKNARSR